MLQPDCGLVAPVSCRREAGGMVVPPPPPPQPANPAIALTPKRESSSFLVMLNVRFLIAFGLHFRNTFLTDLIHSRRECFKLLVWREPSLILSALSTPQAIMT